MRDDLLDDPRYRLVPRLRETGPRLVLCWWTNWKQHRVLVARDEEQLVKTWKICVENEHDAKMVDLWRAEVVLPSEDLSRTWAERARESEFENFKSWTSHVAVDYRAETGELPLGFVDCPYEVEPECTAAQVEDDFSRSIHTYCKLCDMTTVLRQNPSTWWDYFVERRVAYRLLSGTAVVPKGFNGVRADPSRPLHVVELAHFGSDGVKIVLADEEWLGWSSCLDRTPNFFFHGDSVDFPVELVQITDEATAERRQKEAVLKAENIERVAQARAEARKIAVEFFKK